jgi:ATP-dependent protease Clp ATPase subunit
MARNAGEPTCSFCKKPQSEVKSLVTGSHACICDKCAIVTAEIFLKGIEGFPLIKRDPRMDAVKLYKTLGVVPGNAHEVTLGMILDHYVLWVRTLDKPKQQG